MTRTYRTLKKALSKAYLLVGQVPEADPDTPLF